MFLFSAQQWFARAVRRESFRRLSAQDWRQPPADVRRVVERLEDRTLPAITSNFAAGTLTITTNAADNIVITASGGNVLVNGANPDSGALTAATVDFIDVSASGDFANSIDASGVTTAAGFSSAFLSLRLIAGEGNDTVTGSSFRDTIEGGLGDDLLTGGAGSDQYEFFLFSPVNDTDVIDESRGGTDFVCIFTESGGATLDLSNPNAQVVHANLTLTLGSATTIENACANFGGNLLTGNTLNNMMNAGGTVLGGDGDDTLNGGPESNDSLVGGLGNDVYEIFDFGIALGTDTIDETGGGTDEMRLLQFATGVTFNAGTTGSNQVVHTNLSLNVVAGSTLEILSGGDGADTLTAAPGVNTRLRGDFFGAANDTLFGNTGNDTLEIGDGNDTLRGGAGNDTYLVGVGNMFGTDLIDESTGSGSDTIDFANYDNFDSTGVTLDLDSTSAQSYGVSSTLTLSGVIENLVGSPFNDTLSVDPLANVTRTIGGADPTSGSPGDTLNVDLMNNSFTHTPGATGSGTVDVTLAGGTGTINYTSIETLNLLNPGSSAVATTTTVSASPASPGSFGQLITLTATVSPNSGGDVPTGSVTFTVDGTGGSPINLNAAGAASFSTSQLTVGQHTIVASYSSNSANFTNSTSASFSYDVEAIATSTIVNASPASPANFGDNVTFTATVSPNSGGDVPTGSVTFTVDGTPRSPISLNAGGSASFSTSQLTVGQHTIVAAYSSNSANFTNSTSASGSYDIVAVPLVHAGTSGGDNLILRLNGAGDTIQIVDANTNTILSSFAKAGTSNVVINTLDGNDSLTIDESNGLISVPGGVQFDGGAGDDQMKLAGNVVAQANYQVGPETGSGRLEHRIGALVQSVVFHNLEPIIDLVPGSLTVNGTAADNAINVNVGPNSGTAAVGGAVTGQVQIDNFESIEFASKTTITINGLAGQDVFGVSSLSSGFTGFLVTQAGDPADGDQLVLNGSSGDDVFNYLPHPTLLDAGSFTGMDGGLVFSGVETVVVNGSGGNDTLTANALVGDDTVRVQPLGNQEAVLRVNNSTPLRLAQMENITIDTGANSVGGLDRIVVEGTSSEDNVTLKSGEVTVNQQKVVLLQHEQIDVHLGDGADVLTVHPGTSVGMNVYGGDPSGSDVLNVSGSGEASVALTLPHPINGLSGVQEDGGRPVFASGFEQVNVDAGNQSVSIAGTQFDDEISYTPLKASGLDFAAVSRAGVNTQFLIGNAANITLDPVGGLDTVIVNGNVAENTIDVVEGATDLDVTIVGLKPLKLVAANTESLEISGHAGNDTFNVTPGTTPIHIDGGDPIGSGSAQDVINLLPSGTSFSFGNYQPGPEPDEGSLIVSGTPVSFDHIEEFTVSLAGFDEVEMQGSTANDVMRLSAPTSTSIAVGGAGSLPLVLNGIPDDVTFNVLGGDGDDNLVLDFSAGDFGIPINYRGGGNATTDPGDLLTLVGDREMDAGTFTHFDAHSGQIDFTNNATITYAEIEPIQIGIPQIGAVTVLFSDQSETISIQTVDVPMLGGGLLRRDTLIETSHGEKLRFEALNSDLKLVTSGANSGTDQVRVFNKIDARVFEIDGDNSDSIIVDTSLIFAEPRFKAGSIDINADAGGTLEATTVTLGANFSSGKITAGEVVIDAPEVVIDFSDLTGVGIIRADSAGRSLTVVDPKGIVPLMNAAPFLHNVSIDARFRQFSPNQMLFAVVNKDIRVGANGTTPGSIKLNGNIQLTGDTVFDTTGSATVDGGKVDLLNATIFADAAGRDLSINTFGKKGGDVIGGTFAVPSSTSGAAFPGSDVADLIINSPSSLPTGTVRGSVALERPVNLSGLLRIQGDVGTTVEIDAAVTATDVVIGGITATPNVAPTDVVIDGPIHAANIGIRSTGTIEVNGELESSAAGSGLFPSSVVGFGDRVQLNAPTVALGADVRTDGGSIGIFADTLRLTADVTIDTDLVSVNAGTVELAGHTGTAVIVSADQLGHDLTIDASTNSIGGLDGQIDLVNADFRGDSANVRLNDIRLDNRGLNSVSGTADKVLMPLQPINTQGAAGDSPSVVVVGKMELPGPLAITSPLGLIDLSQAMIGGDSLGRSLTLTALGTGGSNGGEVQLPDIVATGLPVGQEPLQSLNVDVTAAPGGQSGNIVARDIILKNASANLPASLRLAGNVSLPASATFRTDSNSSNGGRIDLSQATFSASAANISLTLDSTYFGSANGFHGGPILLGGFSDNGGRDQLVNHLTLDSRSLAPSGGNGGSVTTHGTIDLAGKLTVSSSAGATVTIDHAVTTSGGIEIDPPDSVAVNARLNSNGDIDLAANLQIDVNAKLDATAGAGAVRLAAPTVFLGGDIFTTGGDVTFDGDVVVDASVAIDTLIATRGVPGGTVPGDVLFLGSSLSADAKGRSLSIDAAASTSTSGGDVNLPLLTARGGEFLTRLGVDTRGTPASGLIDLDLGLFLASNGPAEPAFLHLAGDVRLDGNTVISTSDSTAGGSMSLKDANFSATIAGLNLTIDTRATGGAGVGGNVELGSFNTPAGTFDLNDLTIRTTGPTTNGTMFVNHDISIDGDLTLAGDVQLLQAATIFSTSDNVGSAGNIDLSGANLLPSRTLPTSDLALFARHAGVVANQNGGNVLLGTVRGLNNLSITNTTNGAGGRGGSVTAAGPVQVDGQLHVISSTGTTANPSRVVFNSTVQVGAGGLLIDPPDEIVFRQRVTSSGPVNVEANRLIDVRDGIDATQFTAVSVAPGIRLHELLPDGAVSLFGDLLTDGKGIDLVGNVAIAGMVRVDTKSTGSGDAGDVRLLSNTGVLDSVYATPRSSGLITDMMVIDTSAPAAGGSVIVGTAFTGGPTAGMANGTAPVNVLTIDSTGGTANGVIQLGKSIQLAGGGRLLPGGPIFASILTIAGTVQLTDHVTINVSDALTSGGRIDLRRAAVSSAGATAFDLNLDTRYTGSEPNKGGGDVLLGRFDLLPSPVASLRIDTTTTAPSGVAGGSVTTSDFVNLGNQLTISTSPGSGSSTSSVNLNHDIAIFGAGGLLIDRPDTVTLKQGTAIRSQGPVLIEANRTIDLDGSVTAAHAGASGNNVELVAPLIRLSNTITTDEAPSGLSRGGHIVFDGNVLIDGNVTLRTEANNTGNAGNIEFLGGTVGADVPGRDLNLLAFTLDAAGRGGDIRLTQFSNVAQTSGARLNDVIIASTGGTSGTITLPHDITLGSAGTSDPSSLTFGGNVLVTNNVALSTADAIDDGGAINFSLATIGADQSGRGLILDSRYRGSDAARSGGAVTLGTVQNFRGAFGTDLTNVTIRSTSDAGGAAGGVTLGGLVSLLGDLHVAGGPIAVNSAVVGTNGDQTYDFPVTLGAAGTSVAFVARDVLFASTVDNGGKELQLVVSGNTGVAQQPISGAGGLRKLGAGTFTLAAANTYAGTTSIGAGRLNVNGSVASASVGIAGGTLGGTGQIHSPIGMGPAGGGISPGTSPGTLTVNNDVTFFTGTSFDVELDASQRDQLKVTGNGSLVTLDDATLNLSLLASTPQAGETLTIIDNGGSSAVVGTFLNLNEGATTSVGTFNAQISYVGGDGNDVVLTVLAPTPVATINTTGGVITFGSLGGSSGSSGSGGFGGGLSLGPITVARSVDGRALNVSIPRAFLQLDGGSLNTTGSINVPVDSLENVVLAGSAGVTSLVLDLQQMSGNVRLTSGDGDEVPFDAVGLSGFLSGATLVASGFADLRVQGDGNDNLTVATPRIPTSVDEAGILIGLRVTGNGNGTDAILIGLRQVGGDLGSTSVTTSGLDNLTIESTNGHGNVEFDINTLSGANSYTANLLSTDVGIVTGGNATGDNLTIRRFGNVWNPTGARVSGGGPEVQFAGAGRLEVQGGGGDDTLIIDVDQTTGSGLIGLPIMFDGQGGFDALEIQGDPGVAVETVTYQPGPELGRGRLDYEDADGMRLMQFDVQNLEPVIDNMPAVTYRISATDADNQIEYRTFADSRGTHMAEVTIDNQERTSFAYKTKLEILGLGGDDNFVVRNSVIGSVNTEFTPLGLREMRLMGGTLVAPNVLVSHDTLEFIGSAADDQFIFDFFRKVHDMSTADDGLEFQFQDFEEVTLEARQGTDELLVVGSGGNEVLTLSPNPVTGIVESSLSTTPDGLLARFLGLEVSAFDLGDGTDEVIVQGTDLADTIHVNPADIQINGSANLPLLNVELRRIAARGGVDTIVVAEPDVVGEGIIIDGVDVDGGDTVLFTGGGSRPLFIGLNTGPEVVNIHNGLAPVTLANVSSVSFDLQGIGRSVNVVADDADNAITLNSFMGSARVAVDDNATMLLRNFGATTSLTLDGRGGADTFSIDPQFAVTTVIGDAADSFDRLVLSGTSGDDSFAYLPHATLAAAGTFTVGSRAVEFFDTEEIVVNGLSGTDMFNGFGGTGTSTTTYAAGAPSSNGGKVFAAAVATSGSVGTDTGLRAFRSDGLTLLADAANDNSGPFGAAVIAGADVPDGESRVLFQVASGNGEPVGGFELFSRIIAPGEFLTEAEPNNFTTEVNPIAVNIDNSHRIAQLGQVIPGSGDVDLIAVNLGRVLGGQIAVNIDNSDRVANGQVAVNIDNSGRVLGGFVAVNIDNSDRVVGRVLGGDISVNIDNSGRVIGGGEVSLTLANGGQIMVNIDNSGRVVDGQISVNIDNSDRVAGQVTDGQIAVNIDNSHRIAAIVNNDPNRNSELTHTRLRILGADGETEIANGANLAAPGNAVVTGPLPAGTYFIEVTNAAASGEGDYEIVILGVFHNQDAPADPMSGSVTQPTNVGPGQHGTGSVRSNVGNDVVDLTPQGHKESQLRFNNSTPLQLVDFESVTVNPRDGVDQLRVFGTPNSDVLTFDAATLVVNGQSFGHLNTEIFSAFGNSGDDAFGISSGLSGAFTADGGDGRDLLSVVATAGTPVGLALPGTIIDARTITSLAVEAFSLNAGSENLVVAGAPDALSGVSITPTSANSVVMEGGGRTYGLTTTGTLTVAGAAPTSGSQLPLRRVDVHATFFDDTISVSDTSVAVGGGLKSVALAGIPSVRVFGEEGNDTFHVTPSAATSFFIDGGDPIGFGDTLNVATAGATLYSGPQNDEGAIVVAGLRPVSFDRIETAVAGAAPPPPSETIVNVVLPDTANTVVVSRSGNNLLVRRGSTNLIAPTPVADVDVLEISGGLAADRIRLDRSLNGFFQGTVIFFGSDGNDFFDARAVNGSIATEFDGDEGNDTALGGLASDLFHGGVGNDSLVGGDGNDSLDGGDGDDRLTGGNGDDILCGDLGNDRLTGDAGADLLVGHEGNDSLVGGAGEDSLLGLEGNDTLRGDAGNDTLVGGENNDSLFGGDGNDLTLGEEGNDIVNGDAGDDRIDGGDGTDSLLGGAGNDTLFGGAARDTIRGGAGNDSLAGGDDPDSLFGDAGTDTVHRELGIDTVSGAESPLNDNLDDVFAFDIGSLLDRCSF